MASDVTIVDNVIRAIPNMIKISEQLVRRDKSYLLQQIKNFDNKENMHKSLQMIRRGI
jgi:4-phosphopantoate--beta-alanine ligase